MKKIIKRSKDITVDEIVKMVEDKEPIMVFYYSENKRDGLMRFLKVSRNTRRCRFVCPMSNTRDLFEENTIEECLDNVTKYRDVYVIARDERNKIFKLNPQG